MEFTGLDPARSGAVWHRFLAEMARRGVLLRRGGLNFITYSHTAADIAATVEACRESFAALREALVAPVAAGV